MKTFKAYIMVKGVTNSPIEVKVKCNSYNEAVKLIINIYANGDSNNIIWNQRPTVI